VINEHLTSIISSGDTLTKVDAMDLSHSLKGTIGHVEVRYEGGESGKMGQSLREHEGLRKEHWYLAEQPV